MAGLKRTINVGGEKAEIPAALNRNTIKRNEYRKGGK